MNGLGASRVIDAHLHIWPEPRPVRPYPWTPDPHPVEALLPVLSDAGVDAAIQVTPTILEYDNSYGLEVAEAMPDRIGVFGRFDPRRPRVRERLADWMRHPAALGVRLTFFGERESAPGALRELEAFWAAAEELDVPVAVLAPMNLSELAEIAAVHSGMRLIVDHLGLGVFEGSADPYLGWPELPQFKPLENVWFKISTLVETSTEPFPFRDVHDRLAEALELFGAQRLIWASNYPVVLSKCSYRESLEFLGQCEFLSAEDVEWLTHRTFSELLGPEVPMNGNGGGPDGG